MIDITRPGSTHATSLNMVVSYQSMFQQSFPSTSPTSASTVMSQYEANYCRWSAQTQKQGHAATTTTTTTGSNTSSLARNAKRYGMCSTQDSYAELVSGKKLEVDLTNFCLYLLAQMANYDSPLQVWLNELQSVTEVESLSALQAKSVATTPESFEALSVRNAQITIQQIRKNSQQILDELDSIIDSLPGLVTNDGLAYLLESFGAIHVKIGSVVEICRRKGVDFASGKQLTGEVGVICEQTIRFMHTFLMKQNFNNSQIEANVRKLKENFGELVDVTIRKECGVGFGTGGTVFSVY